MGLDHDTMAPLRDQADANHKAYWQANGGSPAPETYFPGFEAGWNAAASALQSGNGLPDDLAQWAKQSATDAGKDENESWEWQHGFKAGAQAAKENQ